MNAPLLRSGMAFLIVTQLTLGWLAQSSSGQASSNDQDQTWSGDVLLPTGVTVASGSTLTIEPGTIVRFTPGRYGSRGGGLYVYGRLIAIGTAGKPIRFTSDALQPGPGDWDGIRLFQGSYGSILDHVIIEFSGFGIQPSDSITISNSIIRWIAGAALPLYGDATVTHNRIYQSGASGIEVHYRTHPIISYNTIWGAATTGGIRTEGFSHATITHNIIRDNPDNGINVTWSSSADIEYNLITGNGVGVFVSQNGDAVSSVVQHNNIHDNTVDAAVQDLQILNATHNWWGTVDPAAITEHTYPPGSILFQPYEASPVDIGDITYDWDNTETYVPKPYDFNRYFFFDDDSTRIVAGRFKVGISDGIAWDGQYLWNAVPGSPTGRIHKLDADGNSLMSFPSPSTQGMGLAYDGQNLWVLDYTQGLVFEVDRSGNVMRSIPAPCPEPQGLTFDGQFLWTMTIQSPGKAFQFDRSGNVIRTLDTPGLNGLAWDGKYLWVNGPTQIDPSNGHIIRQITPSGFNTGYMAWQEPYLWTVEGGDDAQQQMWLVKMLPTRETITLDGLRDDWQGYSSLLQDPQSDNVGSATDIKSVYGFMDASNLYLMLDFYQFSGYDFAQLDFDVDGDDKADYGIGGFFPGETRPVVLTDYSTGQTTWIQYRIDFLGTELHSNAKEVVEFKVPRRFLGNRSLLGVKCYLLSFASDGSSYVIDQTDWAQIEGARTSSNLYLDVGGASNYGTAGSSEVTQTGYAVGSVNSGTAPYGTAVFSFKQNGVVVTEAGVPASPPTTSARIFIDYRKAVTALPGRSDSGTVDINTGIAVFSYGSATANVTYTLRDITGAILSVGHGTIAAGNHFACFIDQLKDEVSPDFSLPSDFQNSTQFGSLEIASDQPISVLALRGTNNQRNEFLITTTPIADLMQPLSNSSIYFPQFVDGGGYTTSLVLLNTSDSIERGILQILDDNGVPLVVNQIGGIPDSSFMYSIPPGGVFRFQTDGFPTDAKIGWIRLTPALWNSTPVGSGVFAFNPDKVMVSESGIPAADSTTHARIYVDLSGGHNTGLAIANITNTNSDIKIRAFLRDGITSVGTSPGPLQLPGNGHIAKFADQFITGLPVGFTGVLDVSSTTPFTALTLRSLNNERNDFLMTTFPIADATKSAPSPIVFPQIGDGGGYITEFILLSSGESYWPSNTTLDFHDETGAPLAVGR